MNSRGVSEQKIDKKCYNLIADRVGYLNMFRIKFQIILHVSELPQIYTNSNHS